FGSISAKGGPAGGNGGFAEVSGEAGFRLAGSVDATAAMGNAGSILIDPFDLELKTGGVDGTLLSGGTTLVFSTGGTAAGNNATIDPSALAGLSGTLDLEAF